MKKNYFLLIVAGVIILTAVVLRLIGGEDNWLCQNGQWVRHGHPSAPQPTTLCPSGQVNSPQTNNIVATSTTGVATGTNQLVGNDRDAHGCIGSAGYTWCELKQKCLRSWEEPCAASATGTAVEVFLPKPDTIVKSPLSVVGQAPGNWFFEASLPVRLIDANGQAVTSTPAQAQSDWMTTALVPFTATLNFKITSTTTATGYLVIAKDNPSGLPQNDAAYRVPVKFK